MVVLLYLLTTFARFVGAMKTESNSSGCFVIVLLFRGTRNLLGPKPKALCSLLLHLPLSEMWWPLSRLFHRDRPGPLLIFPTINIPFLPFDLAFKTVKEVPIINSQVLFSPIQIIFSYSYL